MRTQAGIVSSPSARMTRVNSRAFLSPCAVVTGLTKRLFAMRRSLQSEVPIAAAMEKPDTEKGSAEAVHPGAAAQKPKC